MSEEAKGTKKEEAKPAAKAAEGGGGMKAMLGPIAAGAVLVGIGVGVGMFLASFVAPPPDPAAEGAAKADEHAAAEHAEAEHESILHTSSELDLGELKSNIAGQGGKRYVVMNVVLRIATAASAKLSGGGGGGGGHGGGGGDDPAKEVKRIIQAAFEEHIKTYTMEELNSQAIYKRLDKGFSDIVERELPRLVAGLPKDQRIVQKVVITNLLVQ